MRVIHLDTYWNNADDLVRNLQFRPDGALLSAVVGDPDDVRELCRYDLQKDVTLPEIESQVEDGLTSEPIEASADPVLSRDLELAAEVLLDYTGELGVRLLDTWSKTGDDVWIHHASDDPSIQAMTFSADASMLFIGSNRYDQRSVANVSRYDVNSLFEGTSDEVTEQEPIWVDSKSQISTLATDLQDNWLAIGTDRKSIYLIDLARQKPTRILDHGRSSGKLVQVVRFSPDSKRLMALIGGSLAVWNVHTGQLIHFHESTSVLDVAFSPDGKRFGIVNQNSEVVIYSTDTFTELARYNWRVGRIFSIAFAPDGLTAAVGATEGRIVIWDLDL